MKHILRKISTILTAIVLLSAGCGYHFSGEGSGPGPELHRIAIPLFENNTGEAGLENQFASALRREFLIKGSLEVVPVENAEAVFRGRLTHIYTTEVAHREVEDTLVTRLFVTLDIRCEDAQSGAILWQDNNFVFYEEYFQSDDALVSYENRRLALGVIAREMAVRIHDRFLNNF